MKKIIFSLVCLGAFAFANGFSGNEIEDRSAGYLGCQAFGLCHW